MQINIKEFEITVSESEMWTLTHTLRHDLDQEEKSNHCAQHNGWDTFLLNYGPELEMYRSFCERLGRTDLYNETVRIQKSKMDTLAKENLIKRGRKE